MPVNIELDNYRIVSDSNGWQLCHKEPSKRIDKKTQAESTFYRPIGFYASLAGVLAGLLDQKLKDSNAKTIAELADDYKKTKALCLDFQKNFQI